MGKETYRDVAELLSQLRGYPAEAAVAVELWEEEPSPGRDEPVGDAYFDGKAGCFVLELLRRVPRRGRREPIGMGARKDESRGDRGGDVVVPEGVLTVGELRDALASAGSADPVFLRIWAGDDPEETDEGVYSVMEFPLQDGIYEGDEPGTLVDDYGNELSAADAAVRYAVLVPDMDPIAAAG